MNPMMMEFAMTYATSIRTAPRETALIGRLAGRVRRYLARRRARRALMDLDDHMLRDIGLCPGDERLIATNPWLRRW
jgi:uncharacterized protein YjiS (DUF1127 family)